jgi:hypothetical protein
MYICKRIKIETQFNLYFVLKFGALAQLVPNSHPDFVGIENSRIHENNSNWKFVYFRD